MADISSYWNRFDFSLLRRLVLENGFKHYELFNDKIQKTEELEILYMDLIYDVFDHYKKNELIEFPDKIDENLNFLREVFEEFEEYEKCDEIVKIQNKLNEKNRIN